MREQPAVKCPLGAQANGMWTVSAEVLTQFPDMPGAAQRAAAKSTNAAQPAACTERCGRLTSLESRTWTVPGATAISTHSPPSLPL